MKGTCIQCVQRLTFYSSDYDSDLMVFQWKHTPYADMQDMHVRTCTENSLQNLQTTKQMRQAIQ